MRPVRIAIYCLFLYTLVSCAIALKNTKFSPEYTGVDPSIVSYSNEYLSLAKERGIKFDKLVTIGIKNINQDYVVGICTRQESFREIDIDRHYWETSDALGKIALLFHEMDHCYCGRNHDYDYGKEYGDPETARKDPNKKNGFFKDGCPISLMFPIVVDSNCLSIHYQEYVDELFTNCDPY